MPIVSCPKCGVRNRVDDGASATQPICGRCGTPLEGDWLEGPSAASNGPDFSGVTSLAKAQELLRTGALERLFLMPVEFGGRDTPENILYVPVGVAGIKSGIDNNVIAPLVSVGEIKRYQAVPEYQGSSFIPIAIRITASDPAEFSTTISIWGEALTRE
jgi:hypothetical protein